MDFVSSIINIVSSLWDCCSTRATYLCNLKKNLISLRSSLETLKCHRNDVKRTVDDAESNLTEPMRRTDVVNDWLRRVEAFQHEVEEMLKEGSQQMEAAGSGGLITGCFCCSRPKNCWTGYKLGELVVEKLADVETLMTDGGRFEVMVARIPQPALLVQEMPINKVTGMEPLLEKIWSLVTEQNQIRVIGLFGMGGVGKTTLLKKLHNEFLNRSHDYDLVIWAVVSKDLNLGNVQNQIGDSLGFSWTSVDDVNKKAKDIFRVLSKKKFVVLLDDIWQKLDLTSVGIPPLDNITQGTTSKVLFTTRSESVCGLMDTDKNIKVCCLKWDEAWSLFARKVGEETLNCHPEIPKLAEIVAKECGCLPLALITVGRAMASKKTLYDWQFAINVLQQSAARFQSMDDQVLPILKFSYDNLPSDRIKSCFLYCSLYCEDYSIEKEQLIDCWVAEGFLDEFQEIDEIRTQGHYFIGCLKDACLLESGVRVEEEVKMHDVVRDMAIWVALDCGGNKGKNFISTCKKPKPEEWERAERISLMQNRFWELGGAPICPNLSTLMLQNNESLEAISDDFFRDMPRLRVLNLSDLDIKEIPASVKLLSNLQYLNLSTTALQKIPPGVIPLFSKLKVLDLFDLSYGGWEEEGGPSLSELEGLTHLNDLGITIDNFLGVKRLVSSPKLQLCTKRLFIIEGRGMSSLALSPSPTSLSLSKLKNVKKLVMYDCSELKLLTINLVAEEGEITLLNTLEWLDIFNVDCNILWDRFLPRNNLFSINLKFLNIWGPNICVQDLTWIIYARGLKTLGLYELSNLKQVVLDGFDVVNTFSRLETLELRNLKKIKSVCKDTLAFQCLKTINVFQCPHLKKLPFDTKSAKITLRSIKGERTWWESLEWEDEDTKSTFDPYFTPED